jgi:hypothetical protein
MFWSALAHEPCLMGLAGLVVAVAGGVEVIGMIALTARIVPRAVTARTPPPR